MQERATQGEYTDTEQEVGGSLAEIMRSVRMANPYEINTDYHTVWEEQSQLNIPALVLLAKELPYQNVCFVHRDCVHLQPIHQAIYKIYNADLHCSRVALSHYDPEWVAYVRSRAIGKTIVDLHGTGNSLTHFWKRAFNSQPDLILATGSQKKLAECKSLITVGHSMIERYNSSSLGSLLRWPKRAECEHTDAYIQAEHGAVKMAIKMLPNFPNIPGNLKKFESLISKMEHGRVQRIVQFRSTHH